MRNQATQTGGTAGFGSVTNPTTSGFTQPTGGMAGGAGGWSQPPQTPAFNPALAPLGAQPVPAGQAPVPGFSSPPPLPNTPPSPAARASYANPLLALIKQQNQTGFDNFALDVTEDAGVGMAAYGYTGQDVNGDGIPDTGFQVDPNNPFSRAALLQRSYDQAAKGTTNSMAAQGQLYSGALQRQQNENAFQNQQGVDANMKGFEGLLRELRRRRRDASLGLQQANTSAEYDALTAALSGGA